MFYTYYPLESNGCFFMVALRYSDFVLRYSGTFHCALRLAISSPMLSHLPGLLFFSEGGWLHPSVTSALFFFRGLIAPPETPQPGTTRGDVTLARDVWRKWWCRACSIVAKCFLCPSSFLRNDKENLLPRLPRGGDCRSVLLSLNFLFYTEY